MGASTRRRLATRPFVYARRPKGAVLSFPRPYARYVLLDRIAMGGMAEIFRAKTASEGFAKPVCIKRILPHFLESEAFVTMFRDEAALAARLQHANVVQVFDFGEAEGMLYLAMELVDGADLRKLLDRAAERGRRPTVGQAIQVAIEMCRGLHHAHSLTEGGRRLGIVHRDISPHNVLVSRAGEVKITDFGIAKASERATHTSTGVVKGKLSYMAPEQAEGGTIDHRVDQFATGIVLWELLTGRRLFSGENEASILRRVLLCDVPPPSRDNQAVPDTLEKVVMRALAPDPTARFADMRAFEMELTRVLFAMSTDPAFSDLRAWVEPLFVVEAAPRRTALMPNADVSESNAPTDEDPVSTRGTGVSSVDGVFTSSSEPKKILVGDGALAAAETVVAAGSSLNDIDETIKVSPSPAPAEDTAETKTGVPATPRVVVDPEADKLEPPQSVPTRPARRSAVASFDSTSEPVAFPVKMSDEAYVPTERVRREDVAPKPKAASTSRAPVALLGLVVVGLAAGLFVFSRDDGGAALSVVDAPPRAAPEGVAPAHTPDVASAKPALATPPADTPPVDVAEVADERPTPATETATPTKAADARDTNEKADPRAEEKDDAPDERRATSRRAPARGSKERPEAGRGSALIDVQGSWAVVYLGAKRLGETPTRVELPAGKHRLRLVNPETGKEKSITVTITADKTTQVTERF